MKDNLKNITFSITLFLLPFAQFIQGNLKLIDVSTINNLILINLICLALILLSAFLIFVINKRLNFFNILIFLLISFNVSFYFGDLKFLFLKYTPFASYFAISIISLLFLLILTLIRKRFFNRFIIFFIVLNYINIIFLIFTSSVFQKGEEFNLIKNNFFINNNKIFKDSNYSLQPNMYFIIMDGMTSLDHAAKILNINYKPHQDYLNENNFNIFPSRSNYNTTYLSLASIIQLDYVVKPNSPKYYDRNNFWPYLLNKKNKKPNLINILEENNYEFKWFGNMTASCKNYAYDKNFCSTTELNSTYYVFNSFFANTPLITILRKFFPKLMLSYYGDSIDAISNFINTNKLRKDKSYFTLIHHLSPHPPYIYNDDCSIKSLINTSITSNKVNGYKDAYLCSLKKIKKFINYINLNDPSALIVITADHGWNIDRNNSKKINEIIDEKTKIYNSIKVSNECKNSIPAILDNINSVRLLLGCALNKEPRYIKSETFYGFQEENKDEYGKVYKLN